MQILFFNTVMPFYDTKILEFNQYQTSDKTLFIIYAVLDCLIEKIDGYNNNPENSFTTKVNEYIPSSFSISPISSFKSINISMMHTEVKITLTSFVNRQESTP